jgi:ankyrin repeat protein
MSSQEQIIRFRGEMAHQPVPTVILDTDQNGVVEPQISNAERYASDYSDPDTHEHLEPRLLHAAEKDDVDSLRAIIEGEREKSRPVEHLPRLALARSSEKGNINACQYLLEQGATPNAYVNGTSTLLRAVNKNRLQTVKLLLRHGANPDTADKQGRTALMVAASQNMWHMLQVLIKNGADVNRTDSKKRNVLHNLAADKHRDWGEDTIRLLLETDIHIDGEQGEDELKRTPLHWACATGKKDLAELLLNRPTHQKATVDAIDERGRTALHLATMHQKRDVVDVLIEYGANVNAKSDGLWTPLHLAACEASSLELLKLLMAQGADVNATLTNGMTPLHLVADKGHTDIVLCLLNHKSVNRTVKDTFGSTPFLRAVQGRHKDIEEILAPHNNADYLSTEAREACNKFNAKMVDFGNFPGGNQMFRKSVFGTTTECLALRNANGRGRFVVQARRHEPPETCCCPFAQEQQER